MAIENGSLMSVKKLDDMEQKIEKKNTKKIAAAIFLFTFSLCWRCVFFFVSVGSCGRPGRRCHFNQTCC